MTLVVGAATWCVKALFVLFPENVPILGSLNSTSSSSNTSSDMSICVYNERSRWISSPNASSLSRSSLSRALCQVLDIVNDIPVTSRKYEFARLLADRILSDNAVLGSQALREVNINALEGGFRRTVILLSKCLENLHHKQQVAAWAWPWRMLKDLPYSLLFHCVPLLATLKNGLGTAMHSPIMQMIIPETVTSTLDGGSDVLAEKFADELLWMAHRLKKDSALEVAIVQWSAATSLAHWSLSSSARVQKLLVKLTAFLFAGLVSLDVELHPDMTLRLLLLWLPLLCRSTHVIDETTLSSTDKNDTEQILSKTIQLLPDAYQQVVLALWLNEYVRSSSDWPNVQSCYHGWCQSTRKLYY